MNFASPQRAVGPSTGDGGTSIPEAQQPGVPAGNYDYPIPYKLYYQVGTAWVAANNNSYCAPAANQSAATATPQVPTNTNFILEFTPVEDGSFHVVPDRNALRQTGTNLLKQRTDVNDALSGFGMIRRITSYNNTGLPIYDPVLIPCTVDWVEGYTPSDIADGQSKFRLLLNPRPGGSVTAELASLDKLEIVFPQNLPSIRIEY